MSCCKDRWLYLPSTDLPSPRSSTRRIDLELVQDLRERLQHAAWEESRALRDALLVALHTDVEHGVPQTGYTTEDGAVRVSYSNCVRIDAQVAEIVARKEVAR